MNEPAKSYQQLDPVGGVGTRALTVAGAVLLEAYAIGSTIATWKQVSGPVFAVIAVAFIGVSVAGLVHWSNPLRAPFTNAGFFAVAGSSVGAMVFEAASTWGSNTSFHDDWAPIATGYVLLQLAPYRPPRELTGYVVIIATVRAFVALLETSAMHTTAPPIVLIVSATFPMLAVSLAGAAAAGVVVDSLQRWQHRATAAANQFTDELRTGIERSVQQDRVTILNRDVVPFFSEVLRSGTISADDRLRATSIAESIRQVMIADMDRSWLDDVVDRAAATHPSPRGVGSEVVQDDLRLAGSMSTEQRTAVRALVVALFDRSGFDPDGFGILITSDVASVDVHLTAKLDSGESVVRSELAPYFAVLRVVFRAVHVDFAAPSLTLKFSYDE